MVNKKIVRDAFEVLEQEPKDTVVSVFLHFVAAVDGVRVGGCADRIDEFINDYFTQKNLSKVVTEIEQINKTK